MQALVIGPAGAPLFEETLDILHAAHPAVQVEVVPQVCDVKHAPPADLVLVLQQWPDEYSRADVLTLIDAAPLSRLVVCYGPWCDSDGRTRAVRPVSSRVTAAAAPARLTRELSDWEQVCPPFPLTATRTDSYPGAQPCCSPPRGESLTIGIFAADRALAGYLHDVLTAWGHIVVDAVVRSADLVVWDADPWDRTAAEELAALQAAAEIPLVALCGFPRPHEVHELRTAGASAVILKSIEVGALVEQLERIAMTRHLVSLDDPCGIRSTASNREMTP